MIKGSLTLQVAKMSRLTSVLGITDSTTAPRLRLVFRDSCNRNFGAFLSYTHEGTWSEQLDS